MLTEDLALTLYWLMINDKILDSDEVYLLEIGDTQYLAIFPLNKLSGIHSYKRVLLWLRGWQFLYKVSELKRLRVESYSLKSFCDSL
jgi:hypothetical protein